MTDTCETEQGDLTCRTCGHPEAHHDAGECWTTEDGHETFDDTACPCDWYEPIDATGTEYESVQSRGSRPPQQGTDHD